MKIRCGFVSNSSSSSFILTFDTPNPDIDDIISLMRHNCEMDHIFDYAFEDWNNEKIKSYQDYSRLYDNASENEELIQSCLDRVDDFLTKCAEIIKRDLKKPATKNQIMEELDYAAPFDSLVRGQMFDEIIAIENERTALWKDINDGKLVGDEKTIELEKLNKKSSKLYDKQRAKNKKLAIFAYNSHILDERIIPGQTFIVEYGNEIRIGEKHATVLENVLLPNDYADEIIHISKH